jgi:threonyl-tRNA synthetase
MADEDHGPDYVAEMWRCRACETRDALQRSHRENGKDPGGGAYYGVKPVTGQ